MQKITIHCRNKVNTATRSLNIPIHYCQLNYLRNSRIGNGILISCCIVQITLFSSTDCNNHIQLNLDSFKSIPLVSLVIITISPSKAQPQLYHFLFFLPYCYAVFRRPAFYYLYYIGGHLPFVLYKVHNRAYKRSGCHQTIK